MGPQLYKGLIHAAMGVDALATAIVYSENVTYYEILDRGSK